MNDTEKEQRLIEWAETFTDWTPAIIGLALLGIAVVVALVLMRHFFRRWERGDRTDHAKPGPYTDVWAASGERMHVEPAPDDDALDPDASDEDDDDEDDR